ncbi:MAG TPA: sigma-70 family RNA polymerase sigma factor [Bryobacteraceae bacterium]|nr:sigma-70 family RNA polymerase sigma factor [Bryobacteraceae bacterium]
MADERADVTALIEAASRGDSAALGGLIEAVYPELRAIAGRCFRNERADHTLQCTALINEAYLRLVNGPETRWNNRAHFFGFAARTMRGILVDHARARLAAKRGGGAVTITITTQPSSTDGQTVDVLDLHLALEELETLDATQSRVVELRYFGGLTIEEAAVVMGVSASSVKREWILAKTWLRRRMLGPERSP